MILRKIVIAQHERGLVLKDKQIKQILEPGVYWRSMFHANIEIVDTQSENIKNAHLLALIDSKSEHDIDLCKQYLNVVDLGEYQVALLYQRKTLRQVLATGTRHVFWKDACDLEIRLVDTQNQVAVEKALVNVIARRAGIKGLNDQVYASEVPAEQIGLLFIDGVLVDKLHAGLHAFWKTNRSIKIELIELRLQNMEVSGQEILTKDKVSLRINLSANYKVSDVIKAKTTVKDYADQLYRALQFALREAVGTKSLDSLLADKEALNDDLFRYTAPKMAELGITVTNVGIKDIILPGEMKEILNNVVATEKAAQANVIRRREETAATRSLLNTAKLMDENPTLLRLKEIEALEKVVEKVDTLTIYDGLNGLLKDTVKLQI